MSVLPIALLLGAVQSASEPPGASELPSEQPAAASVAEAPCENRQQRNGDIIICAERVTGYRLDPDVMDAKRAKRSAGRKKPPESYKHEDCGSVGPMGCRGGPTISVVGAALTAAEMARRVASGQEIGSMFRTTPEPTEYELYVAARRERQARERAEAAAAQAKAAKAANAAAASAAGSEVAAKVQEAPAEPQ